MNSDVISTIKKAEVESAKFYNEQVEQSKIMIKEAQVKAKEKAEAEKAELQKQSQNRVEEARNEAKAEVEQLLEKNKLQCSALQDVAGRNMQKSIDYILERIVG